jgi:hypothetical protein
MPEMPDENEEFEPIVFRPDEDPIPDVEVQVDEDPPSEKTKAAEPPKKDASPSGADDKKGDDKRKPDPEFSEKVQKRINRITAQKSDAERDRDYWRQRAEQAEGARASAETFGLNTHTQAVAGKLDAAEREYRAAFDAGDTDRLVKAQRALTQAQFEEAQLNAFKARQPAHPQRQAPQQPAPAPDRLAAQWAKENDWFGKDKILTATAYAIDADLKEGGHDWQTEEYYEEVDRRIRAEFPHRFQQETPAAAPSRMAPSPVAPPTRTPPGKGGNTVVLTAQQREIARQLGVSEKAYAAEVLKMERANAAS